MESKRGKIYRTALFGFLLFFAQLFYAQDSIKVHFLYGSRPGKGFKDVEKPVFGGIHGGHASIETQSGVYGFGNKGKIHITSRRKEAKRNSRFVIDSLEKFKADSVGKQYLSIWIPVTPEEKAAINNLHEAYLKQRPYDYAFLGMRCAASTYEVLSLTKNIKQKGQTSTWLKYFYPKKLRSPLVKMAQRNGWKMTFKAGKKSRKWESDRSKIRKIINALE